MLKASLITIKSWKKIQERYFTELFESIQYYDYGGKNVPKHEYLHQGVYGKKT